MFQGVCLKGIVFAGLPIRLKLMSNPRQRAIVLGVVVLVLVSLLAWGGYRLASNAKVTAEKFTAHVEGLDLSRLQGAARARALRELAEKLNRLEREDRRKVRLGRKMETLFDQMTEEEKGRFLEDTLPTGFKQMLSSFEELPPDRRQQAITNAVGRLRRARAEGGPPEMGTNQPAVLSEELQRKVVTVGLSTFYNSSSAQTKAELAPLLEELQRMMESGRLLRQGPHGP